MPKYEEIKPEITCMLPATNDPINNNKTGPQEGHGVVGMPLDRQTFVIWRRGALGSRDKVSLFRLSRRGFKDINRTVLEQSNRIAGSDRHVIHALLEAHRARSM